jgi:hypothetical protein
MSFVQPSAETLMPALVSAVQSGILTAHESRQMLGIVPWEGPDPAWEDRSPAVTEPEPPPALPAAPATDPNTDAQEETQP